MGNKATLKGTNRKIGVTVTQPIIDRAEQRDSGHCMIADAIKAALPDVKTVSVDLASIRFTDPVKKQRYVYFTPTPVQRALVDFDQGTHTEQFTFHLIRAAQVVESGRHTAADGTSKRPSAAVQGISGGGRHGTKPTKLGGTLPVRGPLGSPPGRRPRRPLKEADKAGDVSSTPKKMTAKEQRTAALKRAKEQTAARDRGEPTTKTGSNVALHVSRWQVREFGLRQLRP
jgi:hypothetical protein